MGRAVLGLDEHDLALAVVGPLAADAAGDAVVAPPLGGPKVAAVRDLLAAVVLRSGP